jgi:hypothetical protein
MEVKATGCCGVMELKDISTIQDARDVVIAALDGGLPKRGNYKKPYIMFTGVINRDDGGMDHASDRRDNYGQKLCDFIREQGLGEVIDTIPPKKNWTGNIIQVWMWMPDWEKVWSWADANIPKPEPVMKVQGWGGDTVTFSGTTYIDNNGHPLTAREVARMLYGTSANL